MYNLVQSARNRGTAGDPLPSVWKGLEQAGTRFLRGQLALVAAGPGVGKSAFVLSYAIKSGVPCLYFSADSDAFTQVSRALSVVSGETLDQSKQLVLEDDFEAIQERLGGVSVIFSYNSSPTLRYIEEVVMGYEELYGTFPAMIVIDNALDVNMAVGEDQAQSLDALMGYLHDMARTTGACVVALHHVTGPYNDANQPIPMSGVKGQIGRVPEMILTLHKDHDSFTGVDKLRVSTVKNRGSKADPSGQTFVELDFDGWRMDIRDSAPQQLPEGWQ